MNRGRIRIVLTLSIVLLIQPACAFAEGLAPSAPSTGTIPLAHQVTLERIPFSETGDDPKFELRADIPALQGSDDPRVADFNARMTTLVQNEMEAFKKDVQGRPPMPPDLEVYSSLEETFTLVSPPGTDPISLKLVFASYVAGAAHPFEFYRTVNYDLQRGRELSLEELFLPGSGYLEAIAAYSKSELGARMQYSEGDPFETGSDPLPENYRNWNLALDGLLITFDLYQVAPYVSGPQTVLVPYGALTDVIDPQGPLAGFIP